MRNMVVLILSLWLVFPVEAATRSEPAWREVTFVANYPWREGFTIDFPADETACRKNYGSKWQQKCSASLGVPGQLEKGVSLSPPATGHWEWQGPCTLRFVPADGKSIRPGCLYKVDINGMRLPGHVNIKHKSIDTRTLPLAARLNESRFWLDPAPGANHRISMALEFNYPVPEEAFNLAMQLDGGSTGKPEIVWNTARDHLSVSWPVPELPVTDGEAVARLPGIGQLWQAEDGLRFAAAGESGAVFRQALPARSGIFKIGKVQLAQERGEGLDQKYVLEIETSLYSSPGDILRNLFLIELPEFKSGQALQPYDWTQAGRVTGDDLARGRILHPLSLQPDNAWQSRFRFELPVQSGRHICLLIDDKLESATGLKLARPWAGLLRAQPLAGQVGFMQPGHILPGDTQIDIYGNELDSISWEACEVDQAFLALLAQSSVSPFEYPLEDFNLSFDSLAVSERGSLPLPKKSQGSAQYATLDPALIFKKTPGAHTGLMLLKLTGVRRGEEVAKAHRLILATDIGLIAKRSRNGEIDCFVYSIKSGEAAQGARVSILGANGKKLADVVADTRGHAAFSSLAGLNRESKPVVAIAEDAGNLAWLPLLDRSRELNYSAFDSGGSHVEANGIIASIFSQRGIYRPGDVLHFGTIQRMADFSLLPENLPLFAELVNPAGRKVWGSVFKPGKYGLAEISWQSLPESISGVYTLNVRISPEGDVIGSASARLESFQPDSMKLKIQPPTPKGWIVAGSRDPDALIELRNLYGTPAVDHRLRIEAATQPATFKFNGYEDYIFQDPAPFLGSGVRRLLPEYRTDENGQAKVPVPHELSGSSCLVSLFAEGFDAGGGRATTGSSSFLISPASRVLGYKLLGQLTNLDYIGQGDKAELEFISLNSELEPVGWKDLQFSLLRRNYVTSLIADGSGGYRYDETPQELVIRSWRQDLPAGRGILALDTAEPGEFLLKALDHEGNVFAQLSYNVAGERLATADDPIAASKMRMRLDRASYEGGDAIAISYSLPYDAIGIAAIERDGVEEFEWFDAHAGDNVGNIRIPENFEGRGFVTLTFMRKPDSPAIYMSPLAYAVAPFTSSISRHDQGLTLDMPKSVLPGAGIDIKLSAKQPGKALVFAVDEGILQLTAWKDPDPLATLLADRALDVSTLQTADLLMPAHAQLLPRLSAFGGGADATPFGAKFQNPFKRRGEPPLVFWSGMIDISDRPVTLNIPVEPWQAGRMRIFAVGSGSDCAGAYVGSVNIAGPLVLSVQAPNAVSPGDEFDGALVLANTTGKEMSVKLGLKQCSELQIIKSIPSTVSIPAGRETVLPFGAKVLDKPGEAIFEFTATADGLDIRREARISLRPAGPLRTTLLAGIAQDSIDLPPTRAVYPQFGASSVSVSALPLPLGHSLSRYLDTYPYGCTEQLVSRAFSQILLAAWPDAAQKADGRKRLLDAVYTAITSRFNGQFISLWPDGDGDLLLTAYAADYLLHLRESGLGRTDELLEGICDSISWNLAMNEPTLAAARASAYAIWVLARSGRVVTQQLETLLRSLDEHDVYGWQQDIAGVLVAAIKKELAMPAQFDAASLRFEPSGWFDEFAQRSLALTLMSRYFPEAIPGGYLDDFLDAAIVTLNHGSFSTFSATQGIRALLSYAAASAPAISGIRINCAEKNVEIEQSGNAEMLASSSSWCPQYKLEIPDGSRPVFWQVATTGYDVQPGLAAASQGIEISREYVDMNGAPITSAKQGDEAIVRIRAQSEQGVIQDCVLNDLLPGCMEMIIPKVPGKHPAGVKAIDRQEDRLLVFADLNDTPLEVEYRVRIVSPGKFIIPAISAEAMYDQSIYGSGASSTFSVRRAD